MALALFALVAMAYRASPKRDMLDSKFALLTSEALLLRGSWDVSPYLPALTASLRRGEGKRPWQLRPVEGRLVYLYPPGIPLLSAVPLAVVRLAGGSTLNSRGTYEMKREYRLQSRISALIGAAAVLLAFRLARRELPLSPSLVVALVAAFGSGYWSVASRTLWSHGWTVVLLSAALLELVRWEDGESQRPSLLGALLVAAFWARPTNAVAALLFTAAVALWHRASLKRLVVVGAAGCGLYLLYSRLVWSAWLPVYAANVVPRGRLDPPAAFLGQLLSAEHGLLVFSPVLFAVGWHLARHGFAPERRGAAAVSLALVAIFLVFYSWRSRWWGAGTVGPRFLCDLTPFLVWLSAHAWRKARERPAGSRRLRLVQRTVVAVLALASVAAHVPGAVRVREEEGERRRRGSKREEIAPLGSALYWRKLPQVKTARELRWRWAELGEREAAGGARRAVRRRRGG